MVSPAAAMISRMALVTLMFSACLTFSGCTKQSLPAVQDLQPSPSLVWPTPPEKPRIQYLYSISRREDIGHTPSIMESLGSFLAGSATSDHVMRPSGVYFSPDESLYVTDPGSRGVHVFDLKQRRYWQMKKYGTMNLVSPIGVVMDEAGLLYVSDSLLRKVFVFGPKGEPVREIGGGDRFNRPTGMAIHSALRRLYVVDTLAHMIRVFDLQGNHLFSFGQRGSGRGEFNFPTALSIDRRGRLYVNDSMNYRIQVFEPDGTFLRLFGKHGDGIGEFSSPKGIALDGEGHIYVADAIFDAVQIFSEEGQILLSFGESGQGPGEFWIPASVFIDQLNRIFVADSFNQRISVFRFLGGN